MPEREDDHSPPSSAVTKTNWSYISRAPYALTTWCITTRQNDFKIITYQKYVTAQNILCATKNTTITKT